MTLRIDGKSMRLREPTMKSFLSGILRYLEKKEPVESTEQIVTWEARPIEC